MDIVDPALPVVVATLRPLEVFHIPSGDWTQCGYTTHGWHHMAAGSAYANVCSPCKQCFPLPQTLIIQGPGNSGPGW